MMKMGSEEEREREREMRAREEEDSFPQDSPFFSPLKTIFSSFKVIFRDPKLFASLFALTTLPLSLLLFSQSLSSRPIKTQIYHLEAIAALSPTRFEARHVWKESRAYAISLVRLNALYFLPSYALSLLASITAVHSTALSCNGKRPTLDTALAAVRTTWRRPLVTAICVYVVTVAYKLLQRGLVAAAPAGSDLGALAVLVALVGSGVEVYLMAVLSLGSVVCVTEERWGWDAIGRGWGLMAAAGGRRFSGWVLSGILVLGSGCIGWEMEEMMMMEGGGDDDWRRGVMGGFWFGNNVLLVCLFGVVALWSFVLNTVFYCECRRGQPQPMLRGGGGGGGGGVEYEFELED